MSVSLMLGIRVGLGVRVYRCARVGRVICNSARLSYLVIWALVVWSWAIGLLSRIGFRERRRLCSVVSVLGT